MPPSDEPTFLPEKKWFLAIGIFLMLAVASGGLRYWSVVELRRLASARGPAFSHATFEVSYARDYTREEMRGVEGMRVLSVIGSVGVVIGTLGASVAAIGLWIVRSSNRRRMTVWMVEHGGGDPDHGR